MNGKDIESVSLYFHIPFCTRKCHYCHFFVLPDLEPLKVQLMHGLKAEWDKWLPYLQHKKIETVYFGGGTPALLGAERIRTILGWIENSLPFSSSTPEITLEANPENITKELMHQYRDAGINRVSIGIQTLDEPLLASLSRLHSPQAAIHAVRNTFEAGISNISIDLMYDLPGQSLASWQNTLQRAVDLPIRHLSLYNLTIEPHTVFFKRREAIAKLVPDEATSLAMYESAVDILAEGGLRQYEISAFAKGNDYARHNVGYWTARPFLGFGPSAFSFWEGSRFRNVANLSKYTKALDTGFSPVDFTEKLEPDSSRRELLAIQLRLVAGADLSAFEVQHGPLDAETNAAIDRLAREGLLVKRGDCLQLTKRGILFYDTVASEIV